MNTLYIHGLKGSPRPDKMAILKSLTTNLLAPQLDYFNNKNVFEELLASAKANHINFIVGSSAGGFMGYWLAKHLNCQALLFNPAVAFQSVIQQVLPVDVQVESQAFYQVILGQQDDVIPYQSTIDYLKKNDQPQGYNIEVIENLGHKIDLDTFEYACKKYVKLPAK